MLGGSYLGQVTLGGSPPFGLPLVLLRPGVFPPGTTVTSYRYEDVAPWDHEARIPPNVYALGTAVVANDGSVTIYGTPGLNVLWGTVFPKQQPWQEPIAKQQYVSFYV
jgi:hypothetical protein